MKATNLKLLVCLLFLQVPLAQAEEVLSGEDVASLVVGNTVQMEFRDAQDDFRTRTFHEYYDPDGSIYGMTKYREHQGNLTHYIGRWEVKDGKFCTSVYGRDYSCNRIKPLPGNNYELVNEGGEIRNVKVYEGKHHGLE
ncbi:MULTISPECIES: hypothetical protein [Gammaproteobacteria]|jgi:hypothetical protein|uniref:Uncharacterized protein n=1 Tax=Marinobacter salsuginis TaxID=418719 RepID=A0A5M3PYA4_9GAMM|nr:hypothetical protein [Marinobacter salsuginis]GBO87860.1 hypothetical protein MSSD14B_15280 [Marinobacter salsuginis]|tara:strand:- start:3662 stop:4078 length:417 start_codon:yes stop_codon:yes gene_type:complete